MGSDPVVSAGRGELALYRVELASQGSLVVGWDYMYAYQAGMAHARSALPLCANTANSNTSVATPTPRTPNPIPSSPKTKAMVERVVPTNTANAQRVAWLHCKYSSHKSLR